MAGVYVGSSTSDPCDSQVAPYPKMGPALYLRSLEVFKDVWKGGGKGALSLALPVAGGVAEKQVHLHLYMRAHMHAHTLWW